MPNSTEYTVEYRNVKHPRLEFKTGTLLMILPKTGWTPEQVLEKYGGWEKRTHATIKNNNLTINTLLKFLPEDLISYIVYHETAHNIERKHNETFWNLINRKHPD